MAKDTTPRGLRNNNPLNLRISKNAWLGKVEKNTDGAFEQFTAMEYGIRAAMRNIQTIVRRNERAGKQTTVKSLVHTWAPSSDGNNEAAYVKSIADRTGIQPYDTIDIKKKSHFCLLVWAMAWVENGQQISMGRVESAYYLAFGRYDPSQLQNEKDDPNHQ